MERLTKKQITFDLNQSALKKHYPCPEGSKNPNFYKQAYADIARFMGRHGFRHRQYSVYISKERLRRADIFAIATALTKEFPWLVPCIRHFDVTNIGKQHDLLPYLRDAFDEQQESEPQSE